MNSIILTSTAEIEQQVLVYRSISTAGLVLGGICLVIAVWLFWRFRIVNIIAVKLGFVARQSIKEIEEANAEKGQIKMEALATAKLDSSNASASNMSDSTTMLLEHDGNETTILRDIQFHETEVTTRLDTMVSMAAEKLEILCDIMMIHTEEII